MNESHIIIVAAALLMIVADCLFVLLGMKSDDSDEKKEAYHGVPAGVAVFSILLQLTAFALVLS